MGHQKRAKMHSDAYFVTGTAHPVCQDYAFAGISHCWANPKAKLLGLRDLPYGIVSDGCSSSPNTDIGSRLLVHALVSEMSSFHAKRDDELIVRVAAIAHGVTKLLSLPEECLDATLLCCSESEEGPQVLMVGDGVAAARHKDGEIIAWHIEYDKSAPEYPSYKLNPTRHARFGSEFSPFKKIHKWSSVKGFTTTKITDDFLLYQCLDSNPEIVAVMSDGVGTFEGMEWHEVVTELMSFKNTKGHFVQRRVKRFLKNCQKNGIAPYDDVSMAAVYLGE